MQETPVVPIPAPEAEQDNRSNYQKRHDQAKAMMKSFVLQLEAYDIPDEKMEDVIDYATILYAKYHSHMKEPRMLRKVVEHFKLKKIPTDGNSN